MEPAYHHLQLVLVDKRPRPISRGDVIVIRRTGVQGALIKRVAACPGDSLVIRGGRLFVNGERLPTTAQIEIAGRAQEGVLLGDERFFVLGDNVNHSIDSRFEELGDIAADEIIGRVVFPAAEERAWAGMTGEESTGMEYSARDMR